MASSVRNARSFISLSTKNVNKEPFWCANRQKRPATPGRRRGLSPVYATDFAREAVEMRRDPDRTFS